MNKTQEIERSIIKTYRKDIWHNFIKGLQDYQMINEGDNVMVCISGGKDSFLLAKCIQELERHGKVHFTAHYVCMDPGYNEFNRQFIEDNAKLLGIPLEIFETNIFDAVSSGDFKNPCYFCAKMRRGYLYKQAKQLGCNKIALGHHMDDVIETTLLSMFYGAEVKTMMPKLHSENWDGVELIRPLFKVREEVCNGWRDRKELTFINCACSLTEVCSLNNERTSKRKVVKEFIKKMKKDNPNIEHNIFVAMENVNLDCVIRYKKDGIEHSFLDEYDL